MFGLFERENSLSENEDFMKHSKESPSRYELMVEASKYGQRRGFGIRVAPLMVSILRNQYKVLNTLKNNPKKPRTEIAEEEIEEIEKLAKKNGVGIVGFTEIPEQLIFENKAVLSKNAIVLGYEMQKKRIDTAPVHGQHIKAFVSETQDQLFFFNGDNLKEYNNAKRLMKLF